MTAQVTEIIIYKNKKRSLCSLPLSTYFSLSDTNPIFMDSSIKLLRGYIGTWEIKKNRLYLIGIEAKYVNEKKVTLNSLFPGYPYRVFAHWFNGELRIPHGKLIQYVHGGFASKYQRDHILHLEKGVIIKSQTRENEIDPSLDLF